MTRTTIRSLGQARAAFWREAPPDVRAQRLRGPVHITHYPMHVLDAWRNWVDAAAHAGRIGHKLALKAVL